MKKNKISFAFLTVVWTFIFGGIQYSHAKVSHDRWDQLLQAAVFADGTVNYAVFKSQSKELDAYIEHLEANSPQSSWSKNEKLAYWINAYNALTVQLIVRNLPLKSITDLNKPWDQKLFTTGGKSYSLNEIENSILRKISPLIHFGVNCASISCPRLYQRAYTPENVVSLLEKQAREFISNPTHNHLSGDKAELSKIFEWYRADFTSGSDQELILFLNKYAKGKLNANAKISYKEYNWGLNERK